MKTLTATEIAKSISKDLSRLCKQAKEVKTKSETTISNYRKEGHLQKRKRKYYLNTRRSDKLNPLEISKRFRREAKEVLRKLNIEFSNLMLYRKLVSDEEEKVKDASKAVLHHLAKMELAMENLGVSSGDLVSRCKLFNYERRRETELYERIFKENPVGGIRVKKTKGSKGDIQMSKKSDKQQIADLLNKLGKSTDQGEKRECRASLRKLGHKGGLGKGAGRPKSTKKKTTKKVTKKVTKKKTKKSSNKSAA